MSEDSADKAGRFLRLSISVTDVEKQAAITVLLEEIERLRLALDNRRWKKSYEVPIEMVAKQ